MIVSMKQEIEDWVAAVHLYDNNNFEESILAFQPIADNSKILFNCGVIRATLGEHQEAVQYYQRAIALDPYLAIAYFQQGVSNFLMGDFEEALSNFNETLGCLRGNRHIDYEQLGLKYKLFSCEVLFNRGLCYVYLQQPEIGMTDIAFAAKEKVTKDHDVIDDAIREKAEGYTVFSIPVGVVYRPSDAKVRNVRKQDYLGKARLVRQASQDAALHRRKMSGDMWALDDRPAEQLSYAATNLYRPNLTNRSRQQSEPPINRNIFPPTPPPDTEKPGYFPSQQRTSAPVQQHQPQQQQQPQPPQPSQQTQSQQRAAGADRPRREQSLPGYRSRSAERGERSDQSERERKAAPPRLELGAAAFDRKAAQQSTNQDPQRPNAHRSHSERPAERRDYFEPREGSREQPRTQHLFGAVDNELPKPLQVSKAIPSETRSGTPPQHHTPMSTPGSDHSPPRLSGSSSQLQKPGGGGKRRPSRTSHPNRIEEEDENAAMAASRPEVVDDGPPVRLNGYSVSSASSARGGHTSSSSASSLNYKHAAANTGPALRVKVHINDDTRYVLLPSLQNSTISDLHTQLARKFSLKLSDLESGRVKIKAQDEEGDFVTVGDAEDWSMVLGMARASAPPAATANDVAVKEVVKIDVWVVV